MFLNQKKLKTTLTAFGRPPTNWNVPTYRVDWTGKDENSSILDSAVYQTDMEYDALDRVTQMVYPQDQDSKRKVYHPTYNKAGNLQSVDMEDDQGSGNFTNYVKELAYDAKGQRLLIAFGNGLMTRYTYDSRNFRLVRLKSEKYAYSYDSTTNTHTYSPQSGTTFQDYAYDYDLVGNILHLTDKTPTSKKGPGDLTKDYHYDPLYRLLSASGRECDKPMKQPPWEDQVPYCHDPTATRNYTREYTYDKIGNITKLHHVYGNSSYNRNFAYISNKNLLDKITMGSTDYQFSFDSKGNQVQENSSRFFEWDHSDQLRAFYIQASSGSEPSVYTHYLYDGGGNRIKKLTRKDSGKVEVTVYIDDVFEESYIKPSGSSIDSNHHWNTLHIMDDSSRVATIRAGTDNNDSTPAIKYNLEDHLGSSSMMVDDSGTLVNREEYYPFGDTSFGGFAKKRYRYTGKEKDEESGLYYYGARYYAPWTCRFISVDPMAIESFYQSPYGYGDNNPIIMNDPSGNQSEVKGTDDSSNKQEGNGGNGGQNGSNTANKGGDKWEEETSVFEPESYPEGKGKKLKGVEIEATKKTNNLSAFFRGFFYGYDGPTAGDLTREEIRRMTSDPIGYLYSGLESTSDVVNYFVGWALEGTGIGELISDPYTEHYRETNQAIKEKIEGFSELSPYEQGKAARYYLEAGGAAAMSYVIGKKSYKIGRGKLKQLRKKRTAGKVGNKDVEIRSDIVLKGGRGGQRVKNLTGPPNSVVKGGEGRIFITDETGNVIWDITKNRAKPVFPGKGFGQKMQPTQKQINLLEKVWGK